MQSHVKLSKVSDVCLFFKNLWGLGGGGEWCLFWEGKWGQSGIQLEAMALLAVLCISRSLSLSPHLPLPPPVALTAKICL